MREWNGLYFEIAIFSYGQFAIGNEQELYKLKRIDQFQNIYGNAGDAFLGDDFGKQGFGNDLADTNHRGISYYAAIMKVYSRNEIFNKRS